MSWFLTLVAVIVLTAGSVWSCEDGLVAVHDLRLVSADAVTRPTAIFMNLENVTKVDDTLLSVSTPSCGRAEIHDHIHENGVMKMRQVEGGVLVAAGTTVTFKPMGLHIMCFDPVLPQTPGKTFKMTLKFQSGNEMTIDHGVIVTMADAMRDKAKPEVETKPHHH